MRFAHRLPLPDANDPSDTSFPASPFPPCRQPNAWGAAPPLNPYPQHVYVVAPGPYYTSAPPPIPTGYGAPLPAAPTGYGAPPTTAPTGYGALPTAAPTGYGAPPTAAPTGYGAPQAAPAPSSSPR